MELISLLFSIVALTITSVIVIKGWWKHRNIYDIELHELFSDKINEYQNNKISEKLNSGEYTILNTEKNNSSSLISTGTSYHILLGKIKK